jgi:tRNA pseudouridine38-40 synthase
LVVVDIAANAFLLHMVRNIVGALLEVGAGRRDRDWPMRLLAGRDRAAGAPTAPPHGLYLVSVNYPGCDFPAAELPPLLQALGGFERL